jgi:hypothetical protein
MSSGEIDEEFTFGRHYREIAGPENVNHITWREALKTPVGLQLRYDVVWVPTEAMALRSMAGGCPAPTPARPYCLTFTATISTSAPMWNT